MFECGTQEVRKENYCDAMHGLPPFDEVNFPHDEFFCEGNMCTSVLADQVRSNRGNCLCPAVFYLLRNSFEAMLGLLFLIVVITKRSHLLPQSRD